MEGQNFELMEGIKFLTKVGATANEIHDVYGDSRPTYNTVAKCSAEFKRG